MNLRDALVPVLILLVFHIDINAQAIDRGPYLQCVTTQSIYIHWRTDSPTDSKVWYGDDPNNLNLTLLASGNREDHKILIPSLTPNTIYYYAVGDSNGQMAGGDSEHFFKASPNQNSTETIRAWILGNAGNDGDDQDDVRDGFYSFIGNQHVDLMLLLGDNAYEDGTDSEYHDSWFEDKYEDRLINSVMWSTFGNHDGGASDSDDESGPYYDIFNFPANGQAGGEPSGTEAYYSFDYGNIHFISINSYDIDRDVGEPMNEWVIDDLNSTTQDWIVAFFHYPPYTGNDNNSSDNHPKETDMRENFVPILEAAGVDLIVSAHHHSYQRSFFINGHHDVSSTWDETTMGLDMGDGRADGDGEYFKESGAEGTVYIVSGSAGGVGSDPAGYPAMFTSAQQLGSVYMEVTSLQMDVKFIDDNGNVDDYFTILKDTPPTVNITNPTDGDYFPAPETITVSATATDNNSVEKVEFYANDIPIGTDFSSPYSISWTIPDSGDYVVKAVAIDDVNFSATSTITIDVGDGTYCVKITNDDDDVEERPNGDMKLNSGDLELIKDSPHNQTVGMRFSGLNIPQGSVINAASIQFTCDKDDNINPCILNIFAEDSDNPSPFTSDDFDLTNRPKTSASVSWSPENWLNVGDSGPAQKTNDISSVIQEVVDRPGFDTDSPIVIIIEGSGKREAESHDGSVDGAPELCVNYSLGPLPVELLNFRAKVIDGSVKLTWATASEENNEYFTLERSTNGRDYQLIGIIPGNGTSEDVNNYTFYDKYPELGENYFRLKQTDFDGQTTNSKIVTVKIDDGKNIQVFPTIVENVLVVKRNGENLEESEIVIHDFTGRSFKFFNFEKNEVKKNLNLKDLSPGIYFVSIQEKDLIETFKIIKL